MLAGERLPRHCQNASALQERLLGQHTAAMGLDGAHCGSHGKRSDFGSDFGACHLHLFEVGLLHVFRLLLQRKKQNIDESCSEQELVSRMHQATATYGSKEPRKEAVPAYRWNVCFLVPTMMRQWLGGSQQSIRGGERTTIFG